MGDSWADIPGIGNHRACATDQIRGKAAELAMELRENRNLRFKS